MFGLNERALFFPRTGMRDGRIEYAEMGRLLQCRTQPLEQQNAGGPALRRQREIRVFCGAVPVGLGDLIVTGDGGKWIVREVRLRRGLWKAHHLELVARAEG